MKHAGEIVMIVKPLIDARRFDEAKAELRESLEAVDILERLYKMNRLTAPENSESV